MLIGLLGIGLIGLLAVGFYLGRFRVAGITSPATSGNVTVAADLSAFSDEDLLEATHRVIDKNLGKYSFMHGPYASIAEADKARSEVAAYRRWIATIRDKRVRKAYTEWADYYQSEIDAQSRLPAAISAIPKPPE